MTRTLRRGAHDPEQWRDLVEGVMAQTSRASALVGDLLDIARAQAGRLVEPEARTPVDVGEAVRAAVKRQRPCCSVQRSGAIGPNWSCGINRARPAGAGSTARRWIGPAGDCTPAACASRW